MNGAPRSNALPVLLAVWLLASALAVPAPAAAQLSPAEAQRLVEAPQVPARGGWDAFSLGAVMEELGVPGVSVAVIHDFRIHWAKGYGVADVETGEPVTPGTLFQAASISKPVAAMASLRAVQEGYFGLDQDVNEILTSWSLDGRGFTDGRAVTPRMLMSHTAGLGDGFGFPGYAPGAARPTTVQILEGAAPSKVGPVLLERPPLTGQQYSGGGVTLQELVLSDAVGRPFDAIARAWVLEPLGMESSTFEQPLPAAWHPRAARAHDGAGRRMDAPWHDYPERAAAGLWTTPSDLARFVLEVQRSLRGESERVLRQDVVQAMVRPVGVGPFAVGFAIEQDGQGWYFSHGGSNRGFRGHLVGHFARGYGLVVMTNASRGSAVIAEIRERVERAYGWDTLDRPVPR